MLLSTPLIDLLSVTTSLEPMSTTKHAFWTATSCSAGAITIFLEVRAPTEEQKSLIQKYASFMHSFIGRGVCEFFTSYYTNVLGTDVQSTSSWVF